MFVTVLDASAEMTISMWEAAVAAYDFDDKQMDSNQSAFNQCDAPRSNTPFVKISAKWFSGSGASTLRLLSQIQQTLVPEHKTPKH